MIESIHAHEILKLFISRQEGIRMETLRKEVIDRFGEGAVFHACSRSEMTFEDLVDFLLAKGKVQAHNGRLIAQRHQICDTI